MSETTTPATCQSCEHCDRREAVSGPVLAFCTAGLCTKDGNWFNGDYVPLWLSGCPDYSPREATS